MRLRRRHEACGAAGSHQITSIAAALAYYAFLAIPSVLLIAVGVFALLASPGTVTELVDRLRTIMPAEATDLISQRLARITEEHGTGLALVGVGGLLAVWAVGGAMQNVMWALNTVYGRDEDRGFVRRRLAAWAMAFFAFVGVALGLLVLGSQLSAWIGASLHEKGLVSAPSWCSGCS